MSLELLTIEEAAAYLQTTAKALYSQRDRGAAPGSLGVKIGRHLRYDRGDLDAWFRSQQNGSGPTEAGPSTGTRTGTLNQLTTRRKDST